ncbi:hypothetical protein QTP88_002484 [Uroleucon formosanum]
MDTVVPLRTTTRVNFMQKPRKDDRVRCPSRVNKINDRAGSLVAADDRSRNGRNWHISGDDKKSPYNIIQEESESDIPIIL